MKRLLIAALFFASTQSFASAVSAQASGAVAPAAAAPSARAADPADVSSLDAIIKALYASISGPKGAPRDFDRLRTLFGPNARMVPTSVDAAGKPRLRSWSVEEYMTAAGPGLMANGFFEREIGRTTESFGNVWHIMSTYDSKYTPDGEPFARGVNSIQLFNGGDRWYIMSVFWDSERKDNPIPASRINRPPV
jgi:hypothetical protein